VLHGWVRQLVVCKRSSTGNLGVELRRWHLTRHLHIVRSGAVDAVAKHGLSACTWINDLSLNRQYLAPTVNLRCFGSDDTMTCRCARTLLSTELVCQKPRPMWEFDKPVPSNAASMLMCAPQAAVRALAPILTLDCRPLIMTLIMTAKQNALTHLTRRCSRVRDVQRAGRAAAGARPPCQALLLPDCLSRAILLPLSLQLLLDTLRACAEHLSWR